MITKQDIERVNNLPDDAMVLMAVVNTNPAVVDNEGSGLETRVKSMMNEAGVPPTLQNRILDDLDEKRNRGEFGKSAVYVVNDDLFERYDLQMDLPERFHYGRPLKSLIDNVLDLAPPIGVLAVDREWARFFTLEQGELSELRRQENVRLDDGDRWDTVVSATRHVPGAQGSGGAGQNQPGSGPRSDSGYDLFEAREDAAQQRFYKDMQGRVSKMLTQRGIKHLVLVGPVQRIADFKAEVPDKAPYEIIGTTNVSAGVGWADPAQILERVAPMVEELRVAEEEKLMYAVQEQGVQEVERVLEFIQQNRVYLLVIPEDGAQMHLYRSHNPDVPYFTKKEMTESPVDGSLMERVTLEEVLPDFTRLYGVEVRRVRGDHAQRLVREFGGLAGLTRY